MKFTKFRRVIYTLTPVIIFFTVGTIFLRYLEKKDIINTQRKDDLVAMPPVDFLKVIESPYGTYYKIDALHLIQSSFSARKGDHTVRIVVTGGSFAMGSPHVDQRNRNREPTQSGGIPDFLRENLGKLYPHLKFEVINVAAGGQNSSRVREIVEIMAQADSDILIVAIGNNEGFIAPTAINEPLHRWVLYRFLKKAMLPEPGIDQRSYFTPQDPTTKGIIRQFQSNILQIIKSVRARGATLILATLPVNLRFIPSGASSLTDPATNLDDPMKDSKIRLGIKQCESGKYQEAMIQFAEADDQAFAPVFIARCYEKMGDYKSAKHFYKIYVEQLPFNRTRPSFNEFVRRICGEKDVLLADLDETLNDLSDHGIPTDEYFVDYCHMTKAGYRLMAGTILDLIKRNRLVEKAM